MEGDPVSVNDGRLLDFDPILGITEKYYEQDGKWIVARDQDATSLIEANLQKRNSVDERARFKSEAFNRVASIPMVVLEELRRKGILNDKKAFRKWLNDRDNLAFRTRPGRV